MVSCPSARILVVEDEALIAETIRQELVRLNYDVVAVTDSGAEAVQLAEVLLPDLVLMDGTLRGPMDGFEAGRRIEQLLGCPIVYVTSNPEAGEMSYWVRKPFTTVMIASSISKALAR